MFEAILDPKTWFFALFACLDNVPNSLTNQRQIIVSSFGFSYLQTTLLGCVDGVIEIVTIWTGINLATRFPNSIAYVGTAYFIPNFLGVILLNVLPWSNKIGLLFGQWLTGMDLWILANSPLHICHRGWDNRFCSSAIMGLERDGWPYQKSYRECNHALSLLRWKCGSTFHVANKV